MFFYSALRDPNPYSEILLTLYSKGMTDLPTALKLIALCLGILLNWGARRKG